jgi:mRNA interferase RelE/StbE
MTYRLEIKASAEKQIRKIPAKMLRLITQRIISLSDDPRPHGVKKLASGLGWRIRVGDYRVIYTINDEAQIVTIAAVKPRQSAYD